MYSNIGQYPSLQGMKKQEQKRLVLAALRERNKWVARRFVLVLFTLFAAAILLGLFGSRFGISNWLEQILLLGGGVFFYLYLLWEINGPVYEAVSRYTNKV